MSTPNNAPGDNAVPRSRPAAAPAANHLYASSAATDSPFQPSSASSVGFRSVQFAGRTRRRPDNDNNDNDDNNSNNSNDDDDDAGSQMLDDDEGGPHWPPRRRRRSSVGARLAALTDLGGVNSIRSFTRSFQRAANFTEVIPQRPSFIFAADQEPIFGPRDGFGDGASAGASAGEFGGEFGGEPGSSFRNTPPAYLSLLRQHLEQGGPSAAGSSSEAVSLATSDHGSTRPADDDDLESGPAAERKGLLPPDAHEPTRLFRTGSTSSIFAWPPHLAAASAAASSGVDFGQSPVVGSYGSFRSARSGGRYGSIGSPGSQASSMAQAGHMWQQQQQQQHQQTQVPHVEAVVAGDGERPAILVKEVEEDGKIILTVEGQSTLPQTIFNSINVLIGVGLLSLPMGIKYAGWICGLLILFLSAAVTSWTAGLLAKCMDLDPAVITFSDLAFISFGPRARLVTSLLFTLELMAACVALIVLFADSLELLFPGLLSIVEWKMLCCLVMVPLNFLPMRLLSVTSVIGIVSCFCIVSIVVIDGLTKKTTPGSLIQPAVTYLFPANWLTLPLSFGLLMSPWGGHSVFPNIYRDMRHPYKYAKAVKITFSFTYMLDLVTAVAGLLMFGDDVKDEITANLLTTSGYPRVLTVFLCVFIGIIPLTKIPLNARPIITTLEVLTGMHQHAVATDAPVLVGQPAYVRGLARIAIRVLTIVAFLVISILFPAFDSIMAFMGSALCFTICITLPVLFHLRLFGHSMARRDKLLQYTVLALSTTISIGGTIWSFLPKSMIGVEQVGVTLVM